MGLSTRQKATSARTKPLFLENSHDAAYNKWDFLSFLETGTSKAQKKKNPGKQANPTLRRRCLLKTSIFTTSTKNGWQVQQHSSSEPNRTNKLLTNNLMGAAKHPPPPLPAPPDASTPPHPEPPRVQKQPAFFAGTRTTSPLLSNRRSKEILPNRLTGGLGLITYFCKK